MSSDVTALSLYTSSVLNRERPPLFLNDVVIDTVTGGVTCSVTEVAGAAGCGKTLFCMLLALQCGLDVQHGGVGGRTAYICCGEGRFPATRLSQLAVDYEKRYGVTQAELMESISIVHLPNSEEVFDTILRRIPSMCADNNVRLVVIDSIAGMFRSEYGTKTSGDMAIRTALLFKFSSELKRIADTHRTRVVIVNQVTDTFYREDAFAGGAGGDINNQAHACIPTLGLAWSHCVNKRLLLSRDARGGALRGVLDGGVPPESSRNSSVAVALIRGADDDDNNNNDENDKDNNNRNDASSESGAKGDHQYCALRRLSLVLSPDDAERSCCFEIRKEGIRGVV